MDNLIDVVETTSTVGIGDRMFNVYVCRDVLHRCSRTMVSRYMRRAILWKWLAKSNTHCVQFFVINYYVCTPLEYYTSMMFGINLF
jgi:hypothetical protein